MKYILLIIAMIATPAFAQDKKKVKADAFATIVKADTAKVDTSSHYIKVPVKLK